MMTGRLVLEPDTIVRFSKSNGTIYTVYGFEKCRPADPEMEAIPQGYLLETALPCFRRVDGVWIVLEGDLADIVVACQDCCEMGAVPTFADLLLEYDKKSVDGLYCIGVLGDRFRPRDNSRAAGKARWIYGGLMLHEIYTGEALRHLRTYWSGSRYRMVKREAKSRLHWIKDAGPVGPLARCMKDEELKRFARLVVNGTIELFFDSPPAPKRKDPRTDRDS